MSQAVYAKDLVSETKPSIGTKAIVATILGNTLEVFDFIAFALFAVFIGRAFFPSYSAFGQLMLTVATFGIGFVMRPLGAILLGAYADRAGRKAALTVTILMMAVGTGILGLVPSYETIGVFAPLLVLFGRLLQGFSAGGELGAATTYLLEMAPPNRRGLYASWQNASQGFGILAGSAMGFLLSVVLTQEQLQSWGWRIPFLFGILIAPIGFYIRSQLDDTLHAGKVHDDSKSVFRELLQSYGSELVWSAFCIVGPTVSSYIISSYMTTYAITVLKLPTSTSMLAGLVAGGMTVFGALVGGHLSDRFGRKVMTVVPQAVFVLLIYPAFLLMIQLPSAFALLSLIALLTFVRMISSAVVIAQIPEAFPRSVRTTGLSISYNAATTIFGGTAQALVTWLIHATDSKMSPAWYLIAANLLTLLGMIMLKARKPSSVLD
jgi:MFS family permease